ncbi:exported hypothetical protein [metagenome]|uniref:Uncharacterized protein n=1 Tax=metagenome TaxID=256318 RepID=A0A2P2C2T6_9ZZZZ
MLTQHQLFRRAAWLALAVACLVVVLASGSFGRAQPTGSYRPSLPPDALENGCWPLPDGVHLDFPYQVRSDEDVSGEHGPRRRLVLQYDLVGAEVVRADLRRAFPASGPEVRAEVTPLEDIAPDSVVRGTVVLDLPPARPGPQGPQCADPFSTKRFPPQSAEPR